MTSRPANNLGKNVDRKQANRRQVLRLFGGAVVTAPYFVSRTSTGQISATQKNATQSKAADLGHVVGEATGERVGMRVLEEGGNAIDAIVAAALTAAIAAPHSTGIGGYGMCAVIGVENGRRIVAIDGNSTAPSALRADSFQPGPDGRINAGGTAVDWLQATGWHAAGVPGVMAGLQLALEQFGTHSFADLVRPAIQLARDGFPLSGALASAINVKRRIFERDEGSRKLFFPDSTPAETGKLLKNPQLAEMLEVLAKANSVEPFYRGDIGKTIADGFAKNGGLVTSADMANYRARIVEPTSMEWNGYKIHTAPLTAGGISVLQMLQCLQAMKWPQMNDRQQQISPVQISPVQIHARVETMRWAWRDRLTLLGDPEFSKVLWKRLLSAEYAQESAERITATIKARKYLAHTVPSRAHEGTINLSAADRNGNFVALTLTHGNAFGACVTVDGLGLTLGHGMSRFDVRADHPNGPGPGKRPLHNMVPTLVTKNGVPVLAVGGTGGRKIPNALFEVLTQYVVLGQSLERSIAAPRLHTEGNSSLSLEKSCPSAEAEYLRGIGYQVETSGNANMSAVASENGRLVRARR